MLHPAPNWIVCGLGGNDVTRIAGGKPQVGLAESIDADEGTLDATQRGLAESLNRVAKSRACRRP